MIRRKKPTENPAESPTETLAETCEEPDNRDYLQTRKFCSLCTLFLVPSFIYYTFVTGINLISIK